MIRKGRIYMYKKKKTHLYVYKEPWHTRIHMYKQMYSYV